MLSNMTMASVFLALMLLLVNGCEYFDPYAAGHLPAPPPPVCRLNRGEIILPENWPALQGFLNDQAAMGVPGTPTVDTTTISGLSAAFGKWRSGVMAPNGKIYGIPSAATSVLIVDPKSNGAFCESVLMSAYFNKF